jgi:hypothetical protein
MTERAAARLLKTLPKLDERRRRLYRAQFTDVQCRAWGSRTWARNVLGDAERTVGAASKVLHKREVTGYPLHRLAWLCELVVALQQSIEDDDLPTQRLVRAEARGHSARVDPLRRRLVAALKRLAPADAPYQRRVAALNDPKPSPQGQYEALDLLVPFARAQRATADARLLADDCGLTEALIEEVEAASSALRVVVQGTWANQATNDSGTTSTVEGRVLRELAYLHDAFATAREVDLAVPAIPLPRTARIASRRR